MARASCFLWYLDHARVWVQVSCSVSLLGRCQLSNPRDLAGSTQVIFELSVNLWTRETFDLFSWAQTSRLPMNRPGGCPQVSPPGGGRRQRGSSPSERWETCVGRGLEVPAAPRPQPSPFSLFSWSQARLTLAEPQSL